MGYFNINSILYNFRKIFKYLSISLAFISFIILALLLMTRDVKAETIEVFPSFPSEAYNFNSRVITVNPSGLYRLLCCNSSPVYSSATGELRFESNGCFYTYNPNTDSDWVFAENFSYKSFISQTVLYSNLDIYYTGTWNVYYPASSSEPTEPVGPADPIFLNYEDSNWSGTLVNGEFTYFYFEMPIIGEQASPIWFYFYDITDMPVPNSDFENGSTAVYVDLNWFYANQNGANYVYRFLNKDGIYHYAVPCSSLFGEYKNNRTYLLNLYWTYDGGTTVGSKSFQWTTNFSQTGITRQENNANDTTLSDRNNFIKQQTDLNNFLRDKSFRNSILLNSLPNSDGYTSPTDNGLNTIFSSLYNAFTNYNNNPVRFYIPFSNNAYIDIPPDIVSSHLPTAIVTLIQLFYWYLFSRFIVKDIARIAQKVKSGEILDSSTGNIKTDLL